MAPSLKGMIRRPLLNHNAKYPTVIQTISNSYVCIHAIWMDSGWLYTNRASILNRKSLIQFARARARAQAYSLANRATLKFKLEMRPIQIDSINALALIKLKLYSIKWTLYMSLRSSSKPITVH